MSGTTLFTGAGVSHAYGLPLTREILPRVWRGGHDGTLGDYLRRLFPGLDALVEGDVELDAGRLFPLITDALSLVDHLIANNSALGKRMNGEELAEFRLLMDQAIAETLASSSAADGTGEDRAGSLHDLARWAFSGNEPFAMVSTNYDTLCDFALLKEARRRGITERIDFGMSWRAVQSGHMVQRPAKPGLSILKLHGSLNWLRCPACDAIYINRVADINALGFRREITDGNTCHCEYAPLCPVLVAPSFVREIRSPGLLSIWQSALEVMRRSRQWILAGYSLPPEDYAIRALLQRAYSSREHDELSITVIQHRPDPATEWRYRLLFPECRFVTSGFREFLGERSRTVG